MRQYSPSNSSGYAPRTPPSGSRFAGAQVTKWLLIILGVSFLVDIVGMGSSGGRLMPYVALGNGVLLEIWRWVTYPFVNINIGSWVFTMITFFVFGRLAEQSIGSRRYLMMLIYTTLVGAAVYAVMSSNVLSIVLTGASGLAMAVLVAVAMRYPNQQVRLLIPPVPMKLTTLVYGLIGLLIVMAIAQRADPAESLAHLSGVGVGFLCMKNLKWLDLGSSTKAKKKRTNSKQARQTKRGGRSRGMKARTHLKMDVSKNEAEVNRILDKVSAEGIGNLTEDERELLKFASKKG